MAYLVIIDKGDVDPGAGLNIPFLIVESKHFAGEFQCMFLAGMDSDVDVAGNLRAVLGQIVAVGIHDHAFFIHHHAAVMHHGHGLVRQCRVGM